MSNPVDEVIESNKKARTSYEQVNRGGEMARDFFKFQDSHAGHDPEKTAKEVTEYYNPAWKKKVYNESRTSFYIGKGVK